MDIVFLSRIQFAVTTMFHILFPALTIGLSLYLVALELLWLQSKNAIYYRMYRFWSKIFAINFGIDWRHELGISRNRILSFSSKLAGFY